MRHVRMLGLFIVAVFAVLPVGGASAAKPVLELTEGGEAVAAGSTVYAGLQVHGCLVFYEGKLTSNGATKDVATMSKASSTECGAGSIEGSVTSATYASSGKVQLKAKLSVTQEGCTYKFSKFTGEFIASGGTAEAEGVTTGKVNKKKSAPTCEKEITSFWFTDLSSGVFGAPFETELK